MIPADSWHLAPAVYASRSTAVVRDIVGARIGRSRPGCDGRPLGHRQWRRAAARRHHRGSSAVGTIGFLTREQGAAAFAVDCLATDRDHAGTVIRLCGVDFTLV